jgi:hypothetical protein
MKKSLLFVSVFTILLGISTKGQEKEEFSIKFGGYVNYSLIYDSRQNVALRENHFTVYPKPEIIKNGEDINDVSSLQATTILTRVNMKVTGGKFLGAKTFGFLETEFMGNSETDVNGLRIRHAYVDLNWGAWSLLLGQYWNPLFIVENFPDVVGSNGGAPFQPFARNPQVRLTYQEKGVKAVLAACSERDFTSTGPKGVSGEYLRNSKIPQIAFALQTNIGTHLIGIAGEYLSLLPEAVNSNNFKSTNRVNSFAGLFHAKLVFDKFVIKGETIYGSNLTNYVMLGGYAVKSEDPVTKIKDYTPLRYFTNWIDMYYGSNLQVGLFIASTKNLGSADEIKGDYYSRGYDIDNLLRIAPRVSYGEGNVKFALEYEYTKAGYGVNDKNGKVTDIKNVANHRIMFAAYYFLNY